VRLADVRLPRWWPIAVIVSTLLARRRNAEQLQRATQTLQAPLTDVAMYVRDRDREAAEREARLLALTVTLARLTWALLVLAAATVTLAVVTLLVY
jgi:hypothetical protein